MIIQCESCSRKFVVKDKDIPEKGRTVQCGYCSVTWHQMPAIVTTPKKISEIKKIKESENISLENIKASDGKTYKILGKQWAQVLPSGKTGIFAKKKIGKELDKIIGRKQIKTYKKKSKKNKEVNPSSEAFNNKDKLPILYEPREGLGFLGYFFLLIIITFSIVGVLKTFENDLLIYFPETEYVYFFLDNQLEYFSETIKNIIVLTKDLITSY